MNLIGKQIASRESEISVRNLIVVIFNKKNYFFFLATPRRNFKILKEINQPVTIIIKNVKQMDFLASGGRRDVRIEWRCWKAEESSEFPSDTFAFFNLLSFRRSSEANIILGIPVQPWNRWDSLESSLIWAVYCFKYLLTSYWNVSRHIKKTRFFQQYNETTSAFGRIKDIINDGFTDTATKGVRLHTPNMLFDFC